MSQSTEMVVIIRPSFKKFCDADACRAALFNQLLYRIAGKAKGQDQDKVKRGEIYWYGSAERICDKELDNSWSINKVIKETKAIIAAGIVGQRHNPVKKWDRTMHYFIGDEQGKIIREQCEKHHIYPAHLGLPPAVLDLLHLVNAFTKCGDSNCQICEMHLPNAVDRFTKCGDAIPKESYKETTKETYQERKSSDPLPAKEISLPPSISTNILSLEEQEKLDWFRELENSPVDIARAKERCAELDEIKTREQFRDLHVIAKQMVQGKKNPRPNLGNMVGALPIWRDEQKLAEDQWWNQSKQGEQAEPSPIPEPELPVVVNEDTEHDEVRTAEPATDEIPAVPAPQRRRSKGMNTGAAESLAGQVAEEYPGLIAEFDEISPGCYMLTIWYGDGEDQWFDLDLVAWWHRTPEIERLLEQAVCYADAVQVSIAM